MHKRALPGTGKTIGQVEIRRYGEQFRRTLKRSPQLGLILPCLVSILGLNLVFVIRNSGSFWLLPASLPLLVPLGAGVSYLSGFLWHLRDRLIDSTGRLHAAFILFFLFFLGVVILYFFLLALPLGLVLNLFSGPGLVVDYRRWSLDLAVAHSLICWGWTVFWRP